MLTGASGFIGSRIAQALTLAGHEMVCVVRDPQSAAAQALPGRMVAGDFTRDTRAADWLDRLAGVDAVINAVGILREHGGQRFATLHVAGPCALFEACAEAGVRRVLQISALGADAQAASGYHLSKRTADMFLLQLPLSSVIVQPSLVFGSGGASARLFTLLASLPLIPLPGRGDQQVQPIHVDDAVHAIVALVENEIFKDERVPLVGPQATSLRGFLTDLRHGMGLGPPRFLAVPIGLVRAGAAMSRVLPGSLLDTETLQMLERGNTSAAEATTRILGHPPRPPAAFIASGEKEAARTLASLAWLLPLLRWSIALVWIVTGIVSFGLYPVADSYVLLARVGIEGALAPVMLYGAALLDLAFGIGTLVLKRRHWLWAAQIAVILAYSSIISLRLPEFWLHPYGPILKNLPLLAALWLLLTLEKR